MKAAQILIPWQAAQLSYQLLIPDELWQSPIEAEAGGEAAAEAALQLYSNHKL